MRRGWRQQDLAHAAGLSVGAISRIERGTIKGVPWSRLASVTEALDATLGLDLRWRGGDLDRLLDAAHAAIVEELARLYRSCGWELVIEATFSEYGERGSIDLFAWHPTTGYVAVNEVKASIADAGRTVTGSDRKARLAPIIAKKLGWTCHGVARFLVVADTSTARRRIREHEATFQAAFPVRGSAGRVWIARPTGRPVAALIFLAGSQAVGLRSGFSRVRRVRPHG